MRRTSLAQQHSPSLKRLEIGALKKEGQRDVSLGPMFSCHHLVRIFRLTTDFQAFCEATCSSLCIRPIPLSGVNGKPSKCNISFFQGAFTDIEYRIFVIHGAGMPEPQDWLRGSRKWLERVSVGCKRRLQISAYPYTINNSSEDSIFRQLLTEGSRLLSCLDQHWKQDSVSACEK